MSEQVVVENFQRRLGSLTSTPSRESIQSLAKWIMFHRKHAVAISDWLLQQQQAQQQQHNNTHWNKQYLAICIMHEIFTIYHNRSLLWERTADFRKTLGQRVLSPAMESLCHFVLVIETNTTDNKTTTTTTTQEERNKLLDEKVRPMIQTWKDWDCLDSPPTFYEDILQILNNRNQQQQSDTATTTTTTTTTAPSEQETTIITSDVTQEQIMTKDEAVERPTMKKEEEQKQDDMNTDKNNDSKPIISPTVDITTDTTMDIESSQKEEDLNTNLKEVIDTPMDNNNNNSMDIDTTNNDESMVTTPIGSDFENVSDDNDTNDISTEQVNKSKKRKLEEQPEQQQKEQQQQVLAPPKEEEYDFEKSDIPFRKVATRELVAPSKAIETMQIARDLRNDTAVQLSSLLSNVSPKIYEACANNEDFKTTIPALSDEILDIHIPDALENIRMYRDICIKLQKARQKCMNLLIESRCQFGSMEAAKEYYEIDGRLDALKKKKGLLNDAMQLEGLDFEDDEQADADNNDKDDQQNSTPSSSDDDDDDMMGIMDFKQSNQDTSNRSANLEELTWYLDSLKKQDDDN